MDNNLIYKLEDLKTFAEWGTKEKDPKIIEHKCIWKAIQQYIDVKNINLIYPKNIFIENANSEIILFTEKELIIVQSPNKNIIIRKINKSKITEYEFIEFGDDLRYVQLTIYLGDKETIVMNSKIDANKEWEDTYKETIINIFKHI